MAATKEATSNDDLSAYIPPPADVGGRQMIGVSNAEHIRISALSKQFNTSNGKIIKALLDYYEDV